MAERRRSRLGAAALALSLALACADRTQPALSGAHLAGDAAGFAMLLEQLGGLSGTPAARLADRWRQRLDGCARFRAHAESADAAALLDSLRCDDAAALPPALAALRGDADWVFSLSLPGSARLSGRARLDALGSVALDARLEGVEPTGLARLLLPADESAGEPRLSTRDVLAHARLRPEGGLELASAVAADGQGDRMFRLRSRLFAGAVLGDAWELAIYLPESDRAVPPMALGVDVDQRAAVAPALDHFVSQLEATWPVHAEPGFFGEIEGACIFDLQILPEFAPCYALAEDVLVVGWNPESVHRALAREREPGSGARDGVLLRLDRFAAADAMLRRMLAPDSPDAALDYAWDAFALESTRAGDAVELRVELRTGDAS